MRLVWTILFTASPLFACSCINNATPCSYAGGSAVIFVARVLTDSGEGLGKGPARVTIEEPLQNVPSGLREAEVETSAGTSCYFQLKAGERYVIITNGPTYSVASCSASFRLQGSEHILDALRSQIKGGPPRLVGTVLKSTGRYSHGEGIENVSLVAELDGLRHETVTDGRGHYLFPALTPGRYEITLSKPGYLSDAEYNRRWSGRVMLNPKTNVHEPEKETPGSVVISKNSCSIWDLAMWPAGAITGAVRSDEHKPLSGVTVQVFGFDAKNRRESSPLRTASTASDGSYTLQPLPPGRYIVGVNARTDDDENVYPPTLHASGQAVNVAESGSLDGIDIVLPPPRTAAQLHIKVFGPDGLPHPGATVKLKNMQGVQRWFSREETDANGEIIAPVYQGEHYMAEAFDYLSTAGPKAIWRYEGTAQIEVADGNPSITIVLRGKP